MSDSDPQADVSSLFRLLLWPVLILVTLVGLVMALQWVIALELDVGFASLLSYRWLGAALVLQVFVAIVVVWVWRRNLQLHGVAGLSVRQAVAMIGINSIGKYAPGKLVGVVARGAVLYRLHGSSRVAVQSAVVEQAAILHSGAAVALTGWLLQNSLLLLAAVAVLVILGSVVLVSRSGEFLVALLVRFSRRDLPAQEVGRGFERSYGVVFGAMVLVWSLSTVALYCCVLAFTAGPPPDFWWLVWVHAVAFMGGFAAFFLPAGLGARDGVMLVLLSAQMAPDVAAYVAVLHRLVTLSVDLLLGMAPMLYRRELFTQQG